MRAPNRTARQLAGFAGTARAVVASAVLASGVAAQEQPGEDNRQGAQQQEGQPRLGPRLGTQRRGAQPADAAGQAQGQPNGQPTLQPGLRAQPGAARAGQQPGGVLPDAGEEMVSFSAFTEPVDLTTLIDFVAQTLGINVTIVGSPTGSIAFNAPVAVPRSRLLSLLDAMLEQYAFTIAYDPATGFYTVRQSDQIRPMFDGALATTRIIETPNVKPSSLQAAIGAAMGWGQQAPTSVGFVDELGVIVVTLPNRDVQRLAGVVGELLAHNATIRYHRIELLHVAAPAARQRAIGLVGGTASQSGGLTAQLQRQMAQQGIQPGQGTGLAGPTLSNLGERLTIDAQGNALLFRGTLAELDSVLGIVEAIDVPSLLAPKRYFAGSSAKSIADIASQRGMGEVITIESQQANQFNPFQDFNPNQQFGQQDTAAAGGPVMVVDVARGSIVYYGTAAQQAELEALLSQIGAEDERIVVRAYRLHHAQAETVAELLNAIISGQGLSGDSPLLPDSVGASSSVVRRDFRPVVTPDGGVTLVDSAGGEVSGAFDPNTVVVVPDALNNQLVVRAPLGQQEELGRLVDKLDLRRPQVYIEALIVSVTDTKDFRLAVETQILNGQYGFQTNFGLSTPAGASGTSPGDFQEQRNVLANLAGGTFALIQSESIPVIINAIRTNTDARIVSQPALLVNNNEEATLASVDEQPTTSQSQTDSSTITSFDGFEEAGTTLTVTPTISEGGYLRLEYEIELSSFTSAGSDGIPSPRQTNNVASSVTIPSDATIVVGGITSNNKRETVRRIPLLGDIPGLGHLFRDTSEITNNSVLYVFITPRIMTDPNFYDLRLLSRGPQSEVAVEGTVPELEPVRIGTGRRATRDWGSELPPAPGPEADPARQGAFIAPPATDRDGPASDEQARRVPLPDDGLELEIVPLPSGGR